MNSKELSVAVELGVKWESSKQEAREVSRNLVMKGCVCQDLVDKSRRCCGSCCNVLPWLPIFNCITYLRYSVIKLLPHYIRQPSSSFSQPGDLDFMIKVL